MSHKIPFTLQSLGDQGYHLITQGIFEGKPCRIVIDTGASKSVVGKQYIEDLQLEDKLETSDETSSGLGTSTMQSSLIKVERFELQEMLISDTTMAVLDLSHVNAAYEQIVMIE